MSHQLSPSRLAPELPPCSSRLVPYAALPNLQCTRMPSTNACGRLPPPRGTTVDQLATKAIECDIERRWLDRTGREGEQQRTDMRHPDIEAVAEQAVRESRARS